MEFFLFPHLIYEPSGRTFWDDCHRTTLLVNGMNGNETLDLFVILLDRNERVAS